MLQNRWIGAALAGVALLLAGCATTSYTPAVWVGATFDELHRAFGDPEAVLVNPSNNRVYVFRETPQQLDETKLTYGDGEIVMEDAGCAILFEMVETTVARWDWYGDGCEGIEVPLPYQTRLPDERADDQGSAGVGGR